MASIEFAPRQHETEQITAHVIWMTSGLSCDGDSVAMTSAVNPSLEDIITGAIPGMPKVVAHTPVLAYENGAEFMQAWYDAEAGKLDPFVLIVEGSIPNEKINGEGHFAGMGVNPSNGQPITTNEWIDRLAPKSPRRLRLGTCATYGGIPAMKNNPTGAMGLCDYLGWGWTSAAGLPVVNIPGCPAQPDNTTEALTVLVMALAGIAPIPELDDQHRLTMHFGRTVHEGCNRAAFYEHGNFATEYGSDHRCLVKLGCKGPVVKCNVPIRGWQSGVGGCPNVGGICMACTMPGFPDKFMPFMDEDPKAKLSSTTREVHLRPAAAVLPQPVDQQDRRQGARVAASAGRDHHRLHAALAVEEETHTHGHSFRHRRQPRASSSRRWRGIRSPVSSGRSASTRRSTSRTARSTSATARR